MCERVVTDLVTFVRDTSHEIGIRLAVLSDDEESGRNIFALENVENRRRPSRIRAVVERQREQAGSIASALHDVRRRQRRELF